MLSGFHVALAFAEPVQQVVNVTLVRSLQPDSYFPQCGSAALESIFSDNRLSFFDELHSTLAHAVDLLQLGLARVLSDTCLHRSDDQAIRCFCRSRKLSAALH